MARHTPCCLLAYAPRQAHIAIIPKMRPMIRAAASPPSNAETWSKRQAKTNAKNTWHTPEAAIFDSSATRTWKGTWWATYDVIVCSEWKRTLWGWVKQVLFAQNQFSSVVKFYQEPLILYIISSLLLYRNKLFLNIKNSLQSLSCNHSIYTRMDLGVRVV